MSDQTISIDGKSYNFEEIGERPRQMLALVQQANQAIQILTPLLEAARAGADATLSDAKKLLPEPLPQEAEEVAEGEVVN